MTKKFAPLKIYQEDKYKLDALKIDLSFFQKTRVSSPETLRRILNIPNLKEVLRIDAERKRRLKQW